MTGNAPTELGQLASLEYMVLGRIENCLFFHGCDYIHLDILIPSLFWIANTGLTGNIPTEVGNLGSMKTFKLAGGDISGSIPTEIGAVSSLKSLDFGTIIYVHLFFVMKHIS